jgi:hypothetical protein
VSAPAPSNTPRPGDAALIVGATLRLSRFVVTDDLGAILIREPIREMALRRGTPMARRLAEGSECLFCAGQWVAFGVLASYTVAARRPATLAAWRFIAAGLALNHLSAHVGLRLRDV